MSNPFTRKDALTDVVAQVMLGEKTLTDAEKKKREEIAQAMERENPGMDMGKKMAIATAQAKKVAEEVDLDEASEKSVAGGIQRARQDVNIHKKNLDDMQKKISRGDREMEHGRWKQLRQSDATKLQQQHKQADDELTKAHADVKKTAVSKFLQTRKGDGKVRTEEVENIDELSQMKLANYVAKAATSLHNNAKEAGQYDDKENANKAFKRWLGIKSAATRLRGRGELPGKESAIGAYPKMKYKTEEVDQDEDLEMFLEEYTTMFNEAEDTQQLMLLRAMAQDPSELMKMKRALKAGDKAMTNPVLRGEILKMLDQMMNLTTTDKTLLQRTRAGFQKAKSMPEEVEQIDELSKDTLGSYIKKANSGERGSTRSAFEAGKTYSKAGSKYNRIVIARANKRMNGINKATDKLLAKEEVEQIDELKKDTMGSYIKKATSDVANKAVRYSADAAKVSAIVHHQRTDADYDKLRAGERGMAKRSKGIDLAVKKLTKEDVEQIDEAKKTTHEDPLITVHKDGRLHAHAHLSTINDIHGTEVKHTAIHAGGAKVKTKYGDNLEYKLSKHHAKGVQESVEVDEAVRIRDRSRGFEKEVKYAGRTFGIDRHGDDKTTFQGQMDRKHLAAAAKARRARTGPGVKGFNSAMRPAKKGEYQPQETGSVRARNEEVDKDAPFEGGREVKSSKSASDRVKKIAKGMQKRYTKDKK